ncbi:hypothetical protein CHUAL_005289 [Chamberlinius hualienensis]
MNHTSLLFIFICYVLQFRAQGQRVDGGWTPWSKYPTECTVQCGGGQQNFTRSCTNPVPFGGGLYCTGSATEIRPCNTEACQSSWSEWTNCNVTCDIGARRRNTLCGVNRNETCMGNQLVNEYIECVDWDLDRCPSPCANSKCPEYGQCIDLRNRTRPMYDCICVMGYQKDANGECSRPSPLPPLPRVIPTLDEVQKTVVIVITRTASTILLITVGLTLLLFIIMRIFTTDRVIQMNMEIALEIAHLLLLFPNTLAQDNPMTCRIVSIGLHFFFTACFAFAFLESVHMYSLVAFVVQKNGLMTPAQNVLTGWGISIVVMLFSICFHYTDYGAPYHCWLRMDTPLLYAEFIPVILIVILTLLMTEAAGNADYKALDNIDHGQLFSAKISQRANFVVVGLIFSSWVLGILSDYEQNLALYSAFSILNAVLGFSVFLVHSLGNQVVRRKLKDYFECCANKIKRT